MMPRIAVLIPIPILICLHVPAAGFVSPAHGAMTDASVRAPELVPPLRSAYDHLGSTSLVTNAHGRRLDRLVYSPWGVPLTGNFSRTRFGYTGHQWEKAAGNWYSVWRYLDPRAGRWTQRDPLGRVDGANVFLYVRNRPLSSFDPTGQRLIVRWLNNNESDMELFRGWLQSLSGIPLELCPKGSADQKEVIYANGRRVIGKGVGGRAVNSLLDEDPPITMRLARYRTFSFDSYDERMLDVEDFLPLDVVPPSYAPSAATRNEELVHVLVEYAVARRNGSLLGPGGFESAHAAANWAEWVYRQEHGQQGRPFPYLEHGPGTRAINYDSGARTVLPIIGTTFGKPTYSEP